jgi:hypothetical protein
MEKVFFQLPEGEWHGARSESLWAQEVNLSANKSLYKIDNIPFYTKAVSLHDVVLGVLNKDWGGIEFSSVVERGGNSTYRVISLPGNFMECWARLETLGCSYESSTIDERKIYALNVPAESNVYDVYEILNIGESSNRWVFEEGCFGHRAARPFSS